MHPPPTDRTYLETSRPIPTSPQTNDTEATNRLQKSREITNNTKSGSTGRRHMSLWSAHPRTYLLTAILLVAGAAGLPTSQAEGTPTVFFHETFDDLDGWTADAGWTITDNHAFNGTSLYFGDDKGTPDRADNDMEGLCENGCQAYATGPTFSLPATGPIFVYLWADINVLDVFAEGIVVDVWGTDPETPGADPTYHRIISEMQETSTFDKVSLDAFAGQTIHLRIGIETYFDPYDWYEGAYLDNLLVTDADVVVKNVVETVGAGPAIHARFTIPEDGYTGRLEAELYGLDAHHVPSLMYTVARDGQLVFGGRGTSSSFDRESEINLLGHEVVKLEPLNEPRGGMGLRMSVSLSGLSAGDYTLAVAAFGLDQVEASVRITTPNAIGDAMTATGGEEAIHATAADFETDTAKVIVGGDGVLLANASLAAEVNGPAFGIQSVEAAVAVVDYATPEGSPEVFGYSLTEQPGTYLTNITLVAGGNAWPWMSVAELPMADPVSFPAVDLSALPLDVPATDPGTPPEPPVPEPWPDAYSESWELHGLIACAVASGPVRTSDRCENWDANAKSQWDLPHDGGVTSLTATVDVHGPDAFGNVVDVCVRVLTPWQLNGQEACTEDGASGTLTWEADPGTHLGEDPGNVTIEVRPASGEGFAYQVDFSVDATLGFWENGPTN